MSCTNIALVTCAVSMAAAVSLILGMSRRFGAIIPISGAPLDAARAVIRK